MPYDVVVGPFNPVALPVVLDFDPPKALGRGVFDVTYEGAPGCVHGAVLAAAFDIILTAANAIEGSVGPTVSLALRYVRPTLTNEEAVFEGWVTEVTERRIFSKGRIVQGGVVTVEADGEFAIFNQDRVNRMASSRRRAFDAGAGSGAAPPGRRGSSARIVARQSLEPTRDPADYSFTHRLAHPLRRDRCHGHHPPRGVPAVPRGGPGRVSPGHRASLRPCGAGNGRRPRVPRARGRRCGTASHCASTTRWTCRCASAPCAAPRSRSPTC